MRRLFFSFFITLLSVNSSIAQDSSSVYSICSNHSLKGGIGMHSLYYVAYEYKLFHGKHWQTVLTGGFGGAMGDEEGGMPALYNLMTGISQQIGFRPFLLNIGIIPILNWYEPVAYTDINGTIGLRFENRNCDSPFIIEAGWIQHFYKTHYNGVYFPVYVGFGMNIN